MAQPSKDLIEDITTRFILTAPSEQLEFFESLMFLVEQAWWYYEDNVRDSNGLRPYNLRDFTELVFKTCPELRKHVGSLEDIMAMFKEFKRNVPVMGAILLDARMEHVLLVRGYKGASCWGFPRGKIMKDESDADCAVREVLEETGYDLEGSLIEDDSIELTLEGKRNKLYIVAGLDPRSAQFAPKCKGEIGGYSWYRVADLPSTKEESNQQYQSADGSKIRFYAVWPFMKKLKSWIRRKGSQWDMPAAQQQQQQQQRSSAAPGGAPKQQPQQQQQQQLLRPQRPPAELRGYSRSPAQSYSSYTGSLAALVSSAAAQPPVAVAAAAAAVAAAAAAPAAAARNGTTTAAAAGAASELTNGWTKQRALDFRLDMAPIMACFK